MNRAEDPIKVFYYFARYKLVVPSSFTRNSVDGVSGMLYIIRVLKPLVSS